MADEDGLTDCPLNAVQTKIDCSCASTSEMIRFETEILTTRKNLKSLMDVPGKWIDPVRQRRSLNKLVLDLNSSVSETYGRWERPS